MIKRKRLDARTFKEWHIAQAKKNRGLSESPSDRGNLVSQVHSDKPEASCLREGDSKSDGSQSQLHRTESEVESKPGNEEAKLEDNGCGILEDCDRASSVTDAQLHEVSHGEMIEVMEDRVVAATEVPSVNPVKMLSSAESEFDVKSKVEVDGEPNCKAYRSDNLGNAPRFIEYWVPVGFSHLQIEKYCEILIKSSALLCSSKVKVMDSLRDVLTTIRECCDHPYLVDSSLQGFVTQGRPVVDYLTTGIEASAKLLLLDKVLQKVKSKDLRVVIVFQSSHSKSGPICIGHILDDFIQQRFGEESYVHIYREYDRVKKKAAFDLFNDKESGRFVMLMEKSSCQPSVKLSSVDYVILFNSDWSPINDMRSLGKMSIHSKMDHLKVLRLYSSNSVEEKVLTLAKEGNALESNMHNFSQNTCHMLLLWGISSLFNKLDDFHGHISTTASLNSVSEEKLKLNVLHELLALLSCPDSEYSSCSLIAKVPEGNDDYSVSISLLGEQDEPARDDDIPPFTIWDSLLQGRNPRWKLLPGSLQGVKRRSVVSVMLSQSAECVNGDEITESKKTPDFRDKILCRKPRSARVRTPAPVRKAGKLAGHPNSVRNGNKPSSCKDEYNSRSRVEETCVRRMKTLLIKQKKEIREFYRTKREERAKLDEEHQLELELVNQTCRETGAKQKELKKLDRIHETKLEEHNRQMDMKRKKLEDMQWASRMKEKQLKDKLLALSKTKNFEGPVSSLINESLIDYDLGAQNEVENSIDLPIMGSDPVPFSEGNFPEEIEEDVIAQPAPHSDPVFPPDRSLTETEIFESDGENNAVSVPREAVSNTKDHNDFLVPSKAVSPSSSLHENQSQDMQHTSNTEIEGNSSTNMGRSKENLLGATVGKQPFNDLDAEPNIRLQCRLSASLESDGENDVTEMSSGEAPDACAEPSNHGSNLGTSIEPQLSGKNHLESLSNLPNSEVQSADCGIEPSGRASNTETEGRGAPDNCPSFNVVAPERFQELTELASSAHPTSSVVLVQPQAGKTTDNPSPFELPVVSLNLPNNEIRQNTGASAVLNCCTSGIHTSCQLDHAQVLSRNFRSFAPPVVQSPSQSCVRHDQLYLSTAGSTNNMQSASRYPQDTSSLRSISFFGYDPLSNELMRIKKEEEEAIKVHEDKTLHLKYACEKEIDEVRKKYGSLLQEADNAFLRKKVDIESSRKKVSANSALAETLRYHYQNSANSSVSQEALLGAVLELPLLQRDLPGERNVAASEPTAPQVVHQLSDLMAIDSIRQRHSPSQITGNSLVCYQARAPAPHLRSYGSVPDRYQQNTTLAVMRQIDGTLYDPVVL